MGLGKTIQTIALLLDAKTKSKEPPAASPSVERIDACAASSAAPAVADTTSAVGGPTLVVAPTSAVIQWSDEIKRFAGEALSVLVYYDKRDTITVEQLKSHDVVLTTYPIAEIEWRSEDNLTKLPCIHCEKYFQPDRLKWHNLYQCGPDAQRTTKQMKTERKDAGSRVARRPTADRADAADTIDLSLGGLPFLQGAAAPDASLSAVAVARKKRSPAATPAADPRTITDVYRKYMHEAGREPLKMYEAAHRALAASGKDSDIGCGRNGSGRAAADTATVSTASRSSTTTGSSSPSSSTKLDPTGPNQELRNERKEPSLKAIDIDDCPEPWTCEACTLLNSGYLQYCEACISPKAPTRSGSADTRSIVDVVEVSAVQELESAKRSVSATGEVEKKSKKTKKKRKTQLKKIAGSPKRPTSSYFYYISEARAAFMQQHPEATVQELSRLMGAAWKSLPAMERVKYEELAAKDKDRYLAEKAAWDKLHSRTIADDDETEVSRAKHQQDQEDSDDDFEPVIKPKRQRQEGKLKAKRKGRGDGSSKRNQKTADGVQAGGGDDDPESDLEICRPTISQYNMQKDSSDRPVAWEGTNLAGSKLHSVVWDRIVLDEAHKIKGRTTNVAKAIYALRSEYKWALTGTPLQNNVGELWGLVRFLKMHPWAYYFCRQKGCNCRLESWTFRRNERRCQQANCCHRSFSHYSYFSTHIIKPIQSNGFAGSGREAMLKLRNEVLHKIQLRRTKALVGKEINLPPLTVKIVKINMHDDERDFYEGIYKQQKLKYDSFAEKGTVLNNYAHIFELLGRMRQACDHPSLIVHGSTKPGDKPLPAKTRTEQVGDLCGICTDLVCNDQLALAKCGHVFHHECIGSFVEEITARKQKPTCPTCHKPLTVTMQLHDGSDTTRRDEAQIKRQLTGLFKDKDPATGDRNGNGNNASHDASPASAQQASAKRQKTSQGALHGADNDEEEDSSDEESELARALAMSMCNGNDDGDEDGPKDEPDEDMQNAGNEDEIDHEELGPMVSNQNDARGAIGKNPSRTEAKQKPTRLHEEGGVNVGRSNFMSRMDVAQFKPSSKLTAVVNAIVQVKEKSGGKGKSIVFSQFVNMLDLVEWQLRKTGMNPVKLVGNMPPAQRASVLAAFKTNPKVDTILLSLRAGGEGLNLQCATHVFLLDPWWNPAVEMQAIQRAHRIGQTQPVEAQRFCVKDSIEDDMLKIQEKKRLVFEGTVDGKAASMAKLTLKDLAFFFKN